MNKDYFITFGFGIMILLVVGVLTTPSLTKGNKISGADTATQQQIVPSNTPQQVQGPVPSNIPYSTQPAAVGSTPQLTFLDKDSKPVQFNNPGGIFDGKTITNYYQGKITVDGQIYYESIPGGVREVQFSSNQWKSTGNSVTESNGIVRNTQSGTTTFSTVKSSVVFDAGIASVLTPIKNADGTLQFTYAGQTITGQGQTFVQAGDKSVTAYGVYYLIKDGDKYTVAKSANGGNPLSDIPTVKGTPSAENTIVDSSGNILIVTADGVTYKTKDGTKDVIVNAEGTTTVKRDDTGKEIYRKVDYGDGSYGQASYDTNGIQITFAKYSTDGLLLQVTDIKTGEVYSLSADGKTITDSNGHAISSSDLAKTNADVASAISSNVFWSGRSSTANFIREVNKNYQALSVFNLWLDKWDNLQEWKSSVDAFFARNYLGTEPIISGICGVWTDQTDAPSNIALSERGLPSAHIEGVRRNSANFSEGNLHATYLYTITFAVDPYGIIVNPSDEKTLTFSVYAYTAGRADRDPLNIERNQNSNIVTLKATEGEYRIDNTDAIIFESSKPYDTVCLEFGNGPELSAYFRKQLQDGRLCNSLIGGD